MCESGGRRRVGQVIGWNVNRLERSDGTFLGRSDALLKIAHLGRERRLVSNRAGSPSEERGNFGAGLRESENIIDEQKDVLIFFVAEILRNSKRGQRDPKTCAGRFIHLAIDQTDAGARLEDRQ